MVHGPPGFQYEHCHPPKLEVTFRNYPVTDRVIECFLGRISWTEVEQLFAVSSLSDESIFGGMDAVTEGVWRTELGRLTKLRGLSVDECGAPGLRAALLPSQDEPAQVLWPALEVLQLRNVSLADDSSVLPDNKDVHVLSQSEAVTKEEWVQDLGDVIRARRSLEAGPRVLSVRHCLSDATALERLSECGVELEVVPESPLYPGDSWYTPEDWEMNALDDCFT
ncbi:hypothetical protein PsYK624_099990 [Phanerochaete sordida]|uniref:Uncharacterized protein n=1 Tax=Phanerochaete sordida TaxID=48140 RepID=A0A9P3LG14_9APHY|nr:hypothetical protein PsYK624_099990 [Phanerochaete sordida]